jgi:hypothetical protein
VLVFGLIVALAGFLTGRSMTAVRARAALTKGIGWLRGEQAGFRTGPVGAWVYRYKKGAVDRCDCNSGAGIGLLGSADWEGDHRHNARGSRCAGDHRVP